MITQASCGCWPMRIIIGFIGWPNIGSGVITPMTGFCGFATREMARVMSYSRSFSFSGERNGMAIFSSR